MPHPLDLWAELKQRKVVRTAGLYLAVCWGAVTVVVEITQILELPTWLPKVVLLLAAVGLPVALLISWMFEWSDGGLHRAKAPVAGARSGRGALAGLIVVSVAAAIGTVWWAWPVTEAPSADTQLIAVLPFTVRGAEEFAYLGDGIADLLSTKLDGAGGLRTVHPRAVTRAMEGETTVFDPTRAADVAARLAARWFVLGSVVEAAGHLEVSASLYDRKSSAALLGQGLVDGGAEELFSLVDRVASDLLVDMSGGPEAQVQRVAGVTTSSLPAFKAYMDGEAAYRHGEYGTALEHFKRAVAIDSTFALAYYRISTAAEWAWVEADVYEGADRAVALADRLPERERRLVKVLGARRRETNADAENVLRSYLGTYPDDPEAWANLGELVIHTRPMHGRSPREAREIWERVLVIDSTHAGALLHLMRLDAADGRLDDMDARLQLFHAYNPEADRSTEMDVLAAAARGDPKEEDAILERLAVAADIDRAVGVWNASVYARNFGMAARICELMAAPERSLDQRREGLVWLAGLRYAGGRWHDALRALDELQAIDPLGEAEFRALFLTLPLAPATADDLAAAAARLAAQPLPEGSGGPQLIENPHDGLHAMIQAYGLGILEVQQGDSAAAAVLADSLAALFLPGDHEHVAQDLALGIRARIALLGQRPEEAVSDLSALRLSAWHGQSLFSPFYARTAERFLYGAALSRVEQNEDALGWLEHIAENSPLEVAFIAPALLMRAEIEASLGRSAEAARLLEAFLKMWAGSDPEFRPVVDRARSRLEDLQAVSPGDLPS